MKNLIRTISLFAAVALGGASSSSALGNYHPGDCAYECTNPTTGETIGSRVQASQDACCSGTAPFVCPAGWTYSGTDFWVNSIGPQLCPLGS